MARKKTIKQDPVVAEFACRLRAARTKLGLSQQELAFQAHVNVGYMGKLERGEAAPGLDMVARLARALGIGPGDLVGGERETSPLPVLKAQIQRKTNQLLSRDDVPALQALSVLLGHVDNSLARRNT
jgi:transcriptional regulator with XRE-family HTH domain